MQAQPELQIAAPTPVTPVIQTVATVDEATVFAEVNRGRFYGDPYYYRCLVYDFKPGWDEANPDRYATWTAALEGGKSYMVGDTWDMATFIQKHKSPMAPKWQRLAFEFCRANPLKELSIGNSRLEYVIHWRGEYCSISLPHHDRGGEKSWISRDGKTKVLINVD